MLTNALLAVLFIAVILATVYLARQIEDIPVPPSVDLSPIDQRLQRVEAKLAAPPITTENIARQMATMSDGQLDKLSVRVFELRSSGGSE